MKTGVRFPLLVPAPRTMAISDFSSVYIFEYSWIRNALIIKKPKINAVLPIRNLLMRVEVELFNVV